MQSIHKKQTQWPESESELYRPSDRRLSAKLLPNLRIEGCRVVSAADPLHNLGLLDRSRYFLQSIPSVLFPSDPTERYDIYI
jgi:hypothetical protein